MMKKLLYILLFIILVGCDNYELYQSIEYDYNVKRYRVETYFGQPQFYKHYSYGTGCQLDSIRLSELACAVKWQSKLIDSIETFKYSSRQIKTTDK